MQAKILIKCVILYRCLSFSDDYMRILHKEMISLSDNSDDNVLLRLDSVL